MAKDLAIYMATHNKKCSYIKFCDYIIPIQVGKVLSSEKIEEISDDIGENISHKNDVYCELTALYWIWKNADAENIGLYHYRRRLDISKEDILRILKDKDIIMPKIKSFRTSLKEQYINEHSKDDWDVMMNVLKELYPKYYEFAQNVFNDNKIYRFNIFICGKDLFDNYCFWIFNILDTIYEKISTKNKNDYQKRYIGFMAERLFTLYILYNKFDIYETNVLFENSVEKYEAYKNFINTILFKFKNMVRKTRSIEI